MNGLQFTDEAARQLEKAYLTRDVRAQRLETIRHLNLSSGESILDIGCGPGFLCESIGEIVGRNGAVVGIDISADLIALCNRRKGSTWLSYEIGDATKLKQLDASVDVVVCTQVAEYVPHRSCFFRSISRHKAERPGGICCNGLGRRPVGILKIQNVWRQL